MITAARLALSALVVAFAGPAVGQSANGARRDEAQSARPMRAAAARQLLDAMRFRERQGIITAESLRATRLELLSECLDMATDPRALTRCDASAAAARQREETVPPELLDRIMDASAEVFAARFTADEMTQVTRFFESAIGRKYSLAYPQVLADVQARKRAIVRTYLSERASAERIAAGGPR